MCCGDLLDTVVKHKIALRVRSDFLHSNAYDITCSRAGHALCKNVHVNSPAVLKPRRVLGAGVLQ